MNIRRELEKLKFIPVPKVFIDPTCNVNDQSKMREIVAKLGGQIAAAPGERLVGTHSTLFLLIFSFNLVVCR